MRASKTVNGKTTKYYYDGNRLMHIGNGSKSVTLVYDRFDEAIGFYYCNQMFYYVKNLQGDITALISDEGFLMAKYTYDDWGNCTIVGDSSAWNGAPEANPLRYRGYVYDNDTGLYYLQSRYYDPETGRFINCDDVNYIGVSESEVSYNPFAYCENEPVNHSDPSGYIAYEIIKSMYSNPWGFLGLGFYNPDAQNLGDFFKKPWSTKRYNIQKAFGYCDAYDKAAWMMGCFIHCAKSQFQYKGRWWRVELWMGRYGISVGGEIGFYKGLTSSKNAPKWFASSFERFRMNFTLNEYDGKKTNKILSVRADDPNNIFSGGWWLTGFKYNVNLKKHPPYSNNLQMVARISFTDSTMAKSFAKYLRVFGWTQTSIKATVSNFSVDIKWTSKGASFNKVFKEYKVKYI